MKLKDNLLPYLLTYELQLEQIISCSHCSTNLTMIENYFVKMVVCWIEDGEASPTILYLVAQL